MIKYNELFKIILQIILPKKSLTVIAGFIANSKIIWLKNAIIHVFIKKFAVNMQDAVQLDPNTYACFNDFFIRHLRSECRPIADVAVVSPVDGTISQMGVIDHGKLLQAKGHFYTVRDLLTWGPQLSQKFYHGQFITFYL